MNQHLQNILHIIQQDKSITEEQRLAVIKSLKDADKELEITAFKLDRTEKVKRTTAILLEETIEELEQKRKAVEAQNRELEIESSLERVRTVAMSMNKPDDMLDVCRIISEQLELLNVKDIRNVQTAIINEAKGIYLNYEYFTQYKRTSILEIVTKLHPTVAEFAKEMMRSKDAFFTKDFEGKELQDWREYRKKTNQDPDPVLDEAKSVHYYFYSIGTGALGISAYAPLIEEEINLFKRFRNVFDLAYRRFIDIEKAIAQAKEAQIETSLERVRAQAMAMRNPEDLTGICEVLYAELQKLGFAEIRNAMINIHDDVEETFVNYDYSDEIGKSINHLHYKIHPLIEKQIKEIRKKEGFSETCYSGKDLQDMITFRKKIGERDDPRIEKADALYYYFYSIGKGSIGISTFNQVDANKLGTIKRFRNVFTLAYQRYTDIARAEAQAREAKIEAALEKVRARTMAMQKSTDLGETSALLFAQLNALVPELWTCGFVLCDKNKTTDEWWLSGGNGFMPDLILPNVGDPLHNNIYKAWLAGESYYEEVIEGEALHQHYDWLMTIPSAKAAFDAQAAAEIKQPVWQQLSCAYFSKGYLVVITEKSCAEENIFIRFAQVFEQTYTRFLDLQKAEAQAREAQIETALERVRSRSMGMQKSEELKDVIKVVYDQLVHLNIKLDHAGFVVDYQPKADWHFWIADKQEIPSKITHPYFNSVWATQFNNAKEKGEELFITYLNFEEKNRFYNELLSYVPGLPQASKDFYLNCPALAASTVLLDNVGLYIENFTAIPYTDEENNTLMRFGKVFQQTYTRFLDLQKAEAQAREAQIEAAMEKVRSRSLAMQKPDELTEVAELLRKEMGQLGVEELETSSIYIVDKEKIQAECWYAIKDIREENKQLVSDEMTITFADTWVGNEMGKFYRAKKEHTSIVMKDDNRKEWINYCAGKSNVLQGYYGDEIPERTYHLVKFNGGYMGAASPGTISAESWDLLRRAASVFSLAYTRFNDLQIAEAHALQAEQDLIAIKEAKQKAEEALTELQATQKQLIQAEKMASLGELTAGIAHEIQNPLNFVNNFSEVSTELVDEMNEELATGNKQYAMGNVQEANANLQNAMEIATDLKQNLEKINHHGKRAGDIVKGMLQHSRSSSGAKEPTNINALADEYLRLAYHGLRAKDKSFNATMKTDFDETIGNINIIPQDIGRVILNLITNAFYVVAPPPPQGGISDPDKNKNPTVWISTKKVGDKVFISVRDNGPGIPQKILDKIFQPFFTTKPTGQGTGLGLSLSYDIVKAHGGEIKVITKENEGTEFTIQLPI